jgi:hypothetical protein
LVCLFFIFLETGLYILSSFPDALRDLMLNQRLVPITSISHTQFQYSEAGRLEMNEAKVAFVGVGKGIAAIDMKSMLTQLEKLSSYFKETQYILVIEHSEPSTESELLKWSDKDPKNRNVLFTVKSTNEPRGNAVHEVLPREGRISLARNTALDAYRKSKFEADYIIAFDVDVLGWDIGGVQDSFGQKDRWDAVCSHGVILHGLYRDVYAFRATGLNTNHHLSGDDHLKYNISLPESAEHRRNLMVSLPPLPTTSRVMLTTHSSYLSLTFPSRAEIQAAHPQHDGRARGRGGRGRGGRGAAAPGLLLRWHGHIQVRNLLFLCCVRSSVCVF